MKKALLSILILTLIIFSISAQAGNKALLLIHDACATKDLKFGEKTIRAEDVHYSTLSTLKNYALIESTDEYLKK